LKLYDITTSMWLRKRLHSAALTRLHWRG